MDELNRAWAILGLAPGASADTVRSAYRDLVKAWHPDKYQGDPEQDAEAQEMLKEINWAYDYLRERAGAEPVRSGSVDVEPSPPIAESPSSEPDSFVPYEPAHSGGGWSPLVIASLVLAVIVGFYVVRSYRSTPTPNAQAQAGSTAPAAALSASSTQSTPPPPAETNLIRQMIPANKLRVTDSAEGLALRGGDTRDFLHTPEPVRPPFIFRATVKTSSDLRFYYGLGLVILNWMDNPIDLRGHDFSTGAISSHLRKGAITPNDWHNLVFDVQTNRLTVFVDGEVRYNGDGFYQNLYTAPGIGPFQGEMILKSVSLEQTFANPRNPEPSQSSGRPLPGDLLASMKAVKGVRMERHAEGLVLAHSEKDAGYIRTTETFKPPFTIRARAKTDSIDLRLYCGEGFFILNWEGNPSELRVHDPASGKVTGRPQLGRILPNAWHALAWEVRENSMRILVDGQVRFQTRGDYTNLDVPAGIGPYMSRVTVSSFTVENRDNELTDRRIRQ